MGLPTNIAVGAGIGIGTGILGALIKRKLDNDLEIESPEQRTSLPMIERPAPAAKKVRAKKIPMPAPEEKEKNAGLGKTMAIGAGAGLIGGGIGTAYMFHKMKHNKTGPRKKKEDESEEEETKEKTAFEPTLGHAGGAVGGAYASYSILNKLFQRKDERQLDMSLKSREDKLNDLLLQEQSMAAGLPKTAMALIKRSDEHMTAIGALEKIASRIYDKLEKTGGDMPISEALKRLAKVLALDKPGTNLAIPAAAAAGGVYYGASRTYNADPNTMKAEAVKDSLRERLTGKDQMVGPMPIRVESDAPEMTPIRPGASSLVDPTRGRDVLEGI